MFGTLLSYVVTKACASPRNSNVMLKYNLMIKSFILCCGVYYHNEVCMVLYCSDWFVDGVIDRVRLVCCVSS